MRRRCCSTATRVASSTTSRGTSSGRCRICFAASSTPRRSIALLAEAGHGNLRLIDNGVVRSRSPALAPLDHVRGYHLVPADVSKAGAVAAHRRARGYAREDTLAIGDSREDLACAPVVGELWLVANALARDPSMRAALAAHANVQVAEESHGAGVYEAVVSALMRRGAAG